MLYVSGSSVATFPVVIFLIALIILNDGSRIYSQKNKNINFLIALSFIVVTFTLVYYDSRAGIFTIIGVLLTNSIFQLLKKNKRGKFQFFLVVVFVSSYQFWAVNYSDSNRQIQDFLPLDTRLKPSCTKNLKRDNKKEARLLEPKTAFNFITDDPFHYIIWLWLVYVTI